MNYQSQIQLSERMIGLFQLKKSKHTRIKGSLLLFGIGGDGTVELRIKFNFQTIIK